MRKAQISIKVQLCYNPHILEDLGTFLPRRVIGSIIPIWGIHGCSGFTDSSQTATSCLLNPCLFPGLPFRVFSPPGYPFFPKFPLGVFNLAGFFIIFFCFIPNFFLELSFCGPSGCPLWPKSPLECLT